MIRLVLAVTSAMLLAGCATIDRVERSADAGVYERHAQTVAAVDRWEIKGRLSARNENKADISRMLWHRAADQHRLELYGTIGARRLRIFQDPAGVILEDTQGERIEGETVEQVILERTGWHLPVKQLIYWMKGSIDPNYPADFAWDTSGHLITISQSGWDVSLANYRPFGPYMLPTRLSAKRQAEPDTSAGPSDAAQLEVRVVISDWGI